MSDDTEQYYDEHIAPELAKLGTLCQERGIPFLAVVDLPECLATTETHPAGPSMRFLMPSIAAKSKGNADTLIMTLMKLARETGHSSACLSILGVEPESRS